MSARALLASPLGFVVGLSLGALGAGGSILAVPVLVHVAGETPANAITVSLAVVAIASTVAAIRHGRAGRVRVRAGSAFGIVGIGGSVAGAALARRLDGDLLMLGFSVLMLVAAWRIASACPGCTRSGEAGALADRREPLVAGGHRKVASVAATVGVGIGVGFLTGLFGVGGGFVVVPALALVLGASMPIAVGTSMLVVAINASVALAVRVAQGPVPWTTTGAFAVAAIAGVATGTRMADRLDARTMQRWFARSLLVLAVYSGGAAALKLA